MIAKYVKTINQKVKCNVGHMTDATSQPTDTAPHSILLSGPCVIVFMTLHYGTTLQRKKALSDT